MMNSKIEDISRSDKISEPERGYESDMRYPQYWCKYEGVIISTNAWIELQEEAEKLLNTSILACENVRQHWKKIIEGFVPFGMRIVRPVKGKSKS